MLSLLLIAFGLLVLVYLFVLALCRAAANDYGPAAERDGHGEWPALWSVETNSTTTETSVQYTEPEVTPQCIHGMHLHNHCPHCAAMLRRRESLVH